MTRRFNLLRYWDLCLVIIVMLPVTALGSFLMGGTVDSFDEGIHLISGALYRNGLVPYVDFYPIFPPIWTYAQIAVEAVFGQFLLTQRLWFAAQGCFIVLVCHMLLSRVVSSRLISLFTITMIVFIGFDPFWLPRWSGARLAVYILFWLLMRHHANGPEEGRGWRLFFLGFFAGLSNLYAFDVGIHLTITGIFLLAVELPRIVRQDETQRAASDLARCAAGFFVPLFIWGAYLAANGALTGYIVTYYYYYMVLFMPISAKILSGGNIALTNSKVVLLLIFGTFLAVAGLYLLLTGWFRDGGRVRTVPLLAVSLSFIVSVSTIRGVEGPQYQMFAFIPMLLWTGYGLDRATGALRGLSFFTPVGQATKGIRFSAAATLIVVLPFAALFALYTGAVKDKLRALRSNINVFRVISAGIPWPPEALSTTPVLKGTFDKSFDAITGYLSSHTSPGEPVLAFPINTEIIPALSGRHSATRYPIPLLVMGTLEGQRTFIEDIERERPRYLIFIPDARYGGKDLVRPYFETVYDYLAAHYRPAPDFSDNGARQIWLRMD